MTAQTYIEFFKATAEPGAFRKIIFICDKTIADLHKNKMGFIDTCLMKCLACSADRNPIENLKSILNRKM